MDNTRQGMIAAMAELIEERFGLERTMSGRIAAFCVGVVYDSMMRQLELYMGDEPARARSFWKLRTRRINGLSS